MTIFVNGKQKRVKRPPAIDGIDVEEFIRRNADPIWLHQNEMWEEIEWAAPEIVSEGDELKRKRLRRRAGQDARPSYAHVQKTS